MLCSSRLRPSRRAMPNHLRESPVGLGDRPISRTLPHSLEPLTSTPHNCDYNMNKRAIQGYTPPIQASSSTKMMPRLYSKDIASGNENLACLSVFCLGSI